MDWQTITAWISIAAAGLYVGWRGVRALRVGKTGCGGGCGCSKSNSTQSSEQLALIPSEELTLRKNREQVH